MERCMACVGLEATMSSRQAVHSQFARMMLVDVLTRPVLLVKDDSFACHSSELAVLDDVIDDVLHAM